MISRKGEGGEGVRALSHHMDEVFFIRSCRRFWDARLMELFMGQIDESCGIYLE
jgi:hypothetical protein